MGAQDDGPSTGARGANLLSGQQQETLHEHKARSTAMRGEAAFERGSGPARPGQRDPSVRGNEARDSSIEPAMLAAFTQELLAGPELGEHDGGLDVAEDLGDIEMEIEAPSQERRVKKPQGARAPKISHGGVDEGGESSVPEDDTPEERGQRSKKWPRVSAKKRIRVLDLHAQLALGKHENVLVGWQAETLEDVVVALPSRAFHLLWRAHDRLPGALHCTVLLQGQAAHRRPDDIIRLGEALEAVTEAELRIWLTQRIERRHPREREEPGEAPPIPVLLDHYDPCHRWLCEESPSLEPDEEWAVPQWLRGARREPLEMCALAVLQTVAGLLNGEGQDGVEGADDPLTAALEIHGGAHPAIARWGVVLAARADSRAGLANALVALLNARESLGQK